MAKKKKLNPSAKNNKQEEPCSFDEVLASLPDDVRKEVEKHGIKSFEDIIGFMLMNGTSGKYSFNI